MKAVKVLGWLIVPFIMIFVQWKKIGNVGKVLGVAWTLVLILGMIFQDNPQKGETLTTSQNTAAPTLGDAIAKGKAEAEAKKKAEAEAKAKAEAEAAKKKAEEEAKRKAAEKNFVHTGEQGVLNSDTFVAANEEAQDEMFAYINANNKQGLLNLASRGQIFFAKKGTKITVVDRGFLNSTVEITETGLRGLVPSEFLSKN